MNNPEIEVSIDAEMIDIHSFQWKSLQLKENCLINLLIYKATKEYAILTGKTYDLSPQNIIESFKTLDNSPYPTD